MKIELSFIGKDSVPFKRELDVPDDIANELKKLAQNKNSSNDEIFDKIDAGDVSNFLNEAYSGISPKVLRTAKCNQVLVDELKKQNINKDCSSTDKIKALYKANLAIAKTLNHQKNVAKNAKEQETKAKDNIALSKDRLKVLQEKQKEQLKKIKAEKTKIKLIKSKNFELYNERMAKLKAKEKQLEMQLVKAQQRIENAEFKYEKRKETKDINLGTSLSAYADFRIIYSWCNDVELDPHKVYNKSLYEKSEWAKDTPAEFWRS